MLVSGAKGFAIFAYDILCIDYIGSEPEPTYDQIKEKAEMYESGTKMF